MRVLVACMLMAMVAIVAIPTVSSAEANDSVCATTLQTALVVLENACSALEPGNVCLGFPGVQPSFLNGDTGSPFDESGQQLALARLSKLRSEALDVNRGRLGVAVLSFAAPNTSPTAVAATGLIIGDVEMQITSYSINVRTAFKDAENQCQQAPAMVILRSPDDTEASLYVNGAMLLLKGMVAIHFQSANSASFIVQEGSLQILNGPAAQAGNTLVAVTDNTGTVMTWAAARPVNEKESQLLTALQSLTSVYSSFAVQVAPSAAPSCTPVTHVVSSGETLYRIAKHYNTTMQSIIEANNISNPDAINAGQALNIPCATGTPSDDAVTVSNPPSNPPATTGNTDNVDTSSGTGDTVTQPGETVGEMPTIPCAGLSSAVSDSFDGISSGFPSGGMPMPPVSGGGGLACQ